MGAAKATIKCYRSLSAADHSTTELARFQFTPDLMSASDPASCLPDKKAESSNQSDDDKHPVLNVETEKVETLYEKTHR
jgi:hypothetical protein